MSVDLEGKRAVVTGGTRGIGAAIARQLASAGASVIVGARSDPGTLPQGVSFVRCDVSTPAGIQALAEQTLERLGGVDIVVSNAGGQQFSASGVLGLTDEDWASDLDANLLAAVRLDRALLPSLKAQGGGVIIHIGSGAARIARPQSLAYSAAKAALAAYSKGLAAEVAPAGIRVNVVNPGVIHSSRLEERVAEQARARGVEPETVLTAMVEQIGIPLRRIGSADELAAAVVFLASPAASYITGTQIAVDGGAMPTV